MISVKVPQPAVVSIAQFREHSISRRNAQFEAAAVRNDVRLPAAIHAPPTVPLEAEDPQATVVSVISTLCGSAAANVMHVLPLPAMNLAGAAQRKFRTARHRAGMENAVRWRKCAWDHGIASDKNTGR